MKLSILYTLACSWGLYSLGVSAATYQQQLSIENGKPFLPCSVKGIKESSKCLLDTGATTTFLPITAQTSAIPAFKKAGRNGCYFVRSQIATGTHVWPDDEFAVCPSSPQFFSYGILGQQSVAHGTLALRFTKNVLNVLDAIPVNLSVSPLELNENRIFMPASTDGIALKILFDTGGGYETSTRVISGVVDLNFVKKHRELFLPVGNMDAANGHGKSELMPIYELMSPLRIKNIELRGLQFIASDFARGVFSKELSAGTSIVLGYPAMKNRDWYFDFERKQWAVQ